MRPLVVKVRLLRGGGRGRGDGIHCGRRKEGEGEGGGGRERKGSRDDRDEGIERVNREITGTFGYFHI